MMAPSQAQPVGAGNSKASQQNTQFMDAIVAIVNDSAITRRELSLRVDMVKRQMASAKQAVPPDNVLETDVLDQMITKVIQTERAKAAGIVISPAEVDEAIRRIALDGKLSLSQYQQKVAQVGLPWSVFRDDVRDEIAISRLRQQEVDSKIQVSDREVESFIKNQKINADGLEEYHLAQIFIGIPNNAATKKINEIEKKITNIAKQANAGQDFGALAVQYSESEDKSRGGDVGFLSSARLPEIILRAISTLSAGQTTSAPIRSDNGFYIFKLIEKRQAKMGITSVAVPQMHVRHILIPVGDGASESDVRTRLLDMRQRILQGKENFAEDAQRYSVDGSASQGGDIGWISPGDTVPAFERAMTQLKDGEISEPVRTEYGYHLIQVLGRREQALTGDQEKTFIRNEIRAKKADQAYKDWIDTIRATSYIENRLNKSQE